MKNQIKLTFSKAMFAFSIFVFSLLLSKAGFAQASYEVMCRNKAKEIAAETYKGCITDQRQTQIEQIRKDYKDKLAKLKNHYDKELKKLSAGATTVTQQTVVTPSNEASGPEITLRKIDDKGIKQRASGARLPKKKTATTQVIDLSSPVEAQINGQDELIQTESRVKSSDDGDIEVVELPSQE